MPNINFTLPHWMYWLGLILVPAFAMYTVRKQRGKEVDNILSKKNSLFVMVLLWIHWNAQVLPQKCLGACLCSFVHPDASGKCPVQIGSGYYFHG